MRNKLKAVLVIALLLRLLLSAVSYHSDVVPFPFAGRVIASGNVANFYDYLWQLPQAARELTVYPRNLFNYPPLTYFALGGATIITTAPLYGFVDEFIYNFRDTLGDIRLNFLLVLLKLPYLPFDIAVAFMLMHFFTRERDKFLAFSFWLFNPVNLYATYMMGMYEIIPTFFVIASLYILSKSPKKLTLPALLLGVGAAVKIFPMMFLVPLAAVSENWKERFKVMFAGIAVYVLTILPFIGSSGFRQTALVAGQTGKSLYLNLPISGGEAIIPYLALLIFFYLVFLVTKDSAENLWQKYFVILILFFVLTHYHPQWFLWITPFLILDLIKSKFVHWPVTFLALFSFFGLITFFDPGLSVGLLAPLAPELYTSKGVWELLGISVDVNYARSILQTIFVGVGLYWTYYYFRPQTKHV